MLLRLIATAGLPTGLAVHGRLGLPPAAVPSTGAPTAGEPAGWPGRLVETVRVHYPGVELVADAALDADSDPYLADYRVAAGRAAGRDRARSDGAGRLRACGAAGAAGEERGNTEPGGYPP